MKNIQRRRIFLLCSLIALLIPGTPALAKGFSKGELIVHISGFANDSGKAMLALVNSVEQYEARKGGETPYRVVSLPIQNGQMSHRFENIPYGEYAIKVFHDANTNGELDTNFIGIPKESYGFSNNVRVFGMPSYEEAKFLFGEAQVEITIIVE